MRIQGAVWSSSGSWCETSTKPARSQARTAPSFQVYGSTVTRAETEERLAREDVEAWIVEEAAEPVGYLQVHPDGLDMFLIPAARGRGLGPDAARAMTEHLLHERGRERVTVDPYAWNEGAVRAWERAGFVEVSRHEADEEHTSSWILMEFRG